MKKLIITAISLLALILVTSCTNEEIIIEKVGRKFNLALNVSTQGLYDQFDLTYSIREDYLRDGSRQIGVFTFVYDEKGDLIKKEQRYLNNFNTTNIQLNDLIEGQYTIVTVETLVNPDDNFSIESFTLDDDEKLSTLKINNKKRLDKNGIEWPARATAQEVIGISTEFVFISEDKSLEIQPKAIGAVIKFMQYNWDKTDKVIIGWGTDDILNYYSLDPSLSRENRYNKYLTATGRYNIRFRVDVNEINPMKYYGAYVLENDIDWSICYADSKSYETGSVYPTSSHNQSIKDGQQYYIGTYLGADNNIYYNLFENVTKLNNWKIELDNTVGPYGKTGANLYTIPYTNWAEGTVSAVKNYMTGISLSEDITLQDNGNYRLTYFDPSNGGILYWYDFKTRTTGLTDSYVIVSKESVTLDKVISELKNEGYELVTQEDEYIFVNSNQTTAVYMYDIGTLIVINYYDPSAYTSSSRSYQQKKQNIREKNISFPQSNNNKMLKSLFKTQSEITMKSDIYKIEMVQLR